MNFGAYKEILHNILYCTVLYIHKTRMYSTVQNTNIKKLCEGKKKQIASSRLLYRKHQNGPYGVEIYKIGRPRAKEETKMRL